MISDAHLWDILNHQGLATGPRPTESKRRKPRKNEESAAQKAVIKWWHHACAGLGVPECLLFSIPNGGGFLGPIVGARLKAEGLRAGVPDLFLAKPLLRLFTAGAMNHLPGTKKWEHGLFIEMKTATGRIANEQYAIHEALEKEGYMVRVCRSPLEAVQTIEQYLRLH